MNPSYRHKVADRVPYSNIRPITENPSNPLSKGKSRPSSGVGVLLLDAIGDDVKSHSVKDHKPSQSTKLNPVDIIKALNPSFRPPSAPIAPPLFSLDATFNAPSKRSKSASAAQVIPHKSRPSSRTSFHSSASAFIDDDASGEGLSVYGYVGTATATPRSELSVPSRVTSAVSRSKYSTINAHFAPFHTSRGVDLGDMVDDAAIDSFLLDFKRKSRFPFAATCIQSFWRMIRQRRAFNRYRSGKENRRLGFKHLAFKAWHSIAVAETMCRAFCLNICFRHWIKVVMDSKGWVNFCSEACSILSQRPTGIPGPILWNLCIQPATWVAAQDEGRALGDPLPVRALVVALQSLQSYCSKCICKTFRRWMKAFKWGVQQRAKGRLKLGHVLRTRFREKFHIKFQMWARWAFFTRARRLHTPFPVFTEQLPFWNAWIEKKKRKLMYAFPFEKTFWFRWMFFKLKKVCQAKVSKSSKLSLVDQVFCVSRLKNALNAWTKGMIVIRSETAFLLSRWKLFCLAIRMRKDRHKMKRELLKKNCAAVTNRAFTKWSNDVRNALSYVVSAHNSHQTGGCLSALARAFYIWTEQRAHAILVSVFMKWSQRARQRITWTIFLRMHAALSQRKLMLSVFSAWRQPAHAAFLSITDAEVVAMYVISHRHDLQRINTAHGNRAFKAVSQQIADARNYTFVRACGIMQTCPFESGDKLCIQLTSTLWLQQIKSIISVKPSASTGYTSSSNLPHRNLNDVFNACRDLLNSSFVDQILVQPRQTFSAAQDVSECNWGNCALSAAASMSQYRQSSVSLVWSDLVYLFSVTSNSCAHENSLRQHSTKAEMATAIQDSSDKTISKSKQRGDNFVTRCLQLIGMRMWLSSVVGGWYSMSALVPLIRNVGAVWDLRLKERRALALRDNLIIISGKVKDESSIFATLFKTKKAKSKVFKKKRAKKKSASSKVAAGSSPIAASGDESSGTGCSPSPMNKSAGFPPVQLSESIIKLPDQNMTMIQRLTNMVHSSNDPISSFALSETVSEAMQPDTDMYDQQLHNRYVAIANEFAVSTSFQQDYNSDSDEPLAELNGIDSDEEETSFRPQDVQVLRKQVPDFQIVEEDDDSQKTAITLDASSSVGVDFHVSLAMKQFIAPKPVRVPRVALPVSLLAVAKNLTLQLQSNYENAKTDLHSQILEVVAHKPADPHSDESSEIDSIEDNDGALYSSPNVSAVNQEFGSQFMSQSSDQMVVNSDLKGVTVISPQKSAPNILFDLEGDLCITKDELKHLDRCLPAVPGISPSFSSLEAKFVLPFSPLAKGKPFQHWNSHYELDTSKLKEDMPVLLAIPTAKGSKQPKHQILKKDAVVFSPPVVSASSISPACHSSPSLPLSIPHAAQELDFSLPEVPDSVMVRPPNCNAIGVFPRPTTPSKQNRCKSTPDRLGELLMAINSSSEKEYKPISKSQSSAADTSSDKVGPLSSESLSKDVYVESRKQYDEIGQKNARMRKHAQSESSNAARALNQSEEASNRRKELLHEATESAYDALELMAPHLKAIFEENFDALINRVIDANAKNHSSADHHHWHELNVQRNTELRGAFLGGLIVDSDDHVKRVFQSRQHYRAMMAKLEGRTEVEPSYGNSRAEKSKPSVELDRDLYSSIKAPKVTPATFTSGDREFVTGLAKPLSNAAMKVPFPNPSLNNLPISAHADFAHFSQMQMGRSFNRVHSGQSSARPFYNAPTPHPQSTPRDDVLVQAPQFVVVDAMKLNAIPQQLHIAGSEIPELSILDNAEAAFLKAKNTRSALSKPGLPHPAFKTTANSASKSAVHSAGLPSVGGTSLGVAVAKKQPLPKLESSHSFSDFAPERSSVSCSTTISEKDAICNIQGLVQAKSILKPVPLQTASSKTSSAISSASFQRLVHARDTHVASSLENRVLSVFDTHVPHSDSVLAPKTLSSSQILGLHDTKQTTRCDADSEVVHFVSAESNQSYAASGDLSISASPCQSPSPPVVGSFSASQAATDFNQFLASFSIEDLFNKPQVLDPTKEKATQNRLFSLAASSKSTKHVEVPKASLNVPLPVRSAPSFKLETVPSSSSIGAELPGPPSEASPLIVHVIPVSKSTAAYHIHDSTGIPTSALVLPVSNQATITPDHSRISVVFSQDTVPSPSVASATAPPDPNKSTEHAAQSLCAPLESVVSENSRVSSVASNERAAAEFIEEPIVEKPMAIAAAPLQTVFDVHASTVHPERLSTRDSEVCPPSGARDVDSSLESAQILMQSVPQAPHTTPHASQQHSVSQPLHSAHVKAAPKPGVQGSAIRSVLLNIRNKAVTNTVQEDDSGPSGIIQQQRASAVELIRQRSMQNPESRQRPSSGDVAAGFSASRASAADNRQRSSQDRKGSDLDDSDEELGTGHVLKNQKIKILQSHMSTLSREFNALRSMYPPSQEIGERGDIAAGVDHFHDASARITDRSADNSSITNRLSAFISELGRKSPARGALFSFDNPNEAGATKGQGEIRVHPVRAARNASKQLSGAAVSSESAAAAPDFHSDEMPAKKQEVVTMRMVKTKALDPAAFA